LASAAFQGAQFSQLSALLTSSSTQQYMDQSSMLDVLSRQNHASLSQLSAVVAQTAAADKAAQGAQQQAQQAADAAAKISSDLGQKQNALDTQIQQVKTQLAQLSATARAARAAPGNMGSFVAPSGIAGAAMQVALAQRGIMYVWGGTSPSQGFDCSGLVQYSYAQKRNTELGSRCLATPFSQVTLSSLVRQATFTTKASTSVITRWSTPRRSVLRSGSKRYGPLNTLALAGSVPESNAPRGT
jgi:cell wall-associated NlpC family hydrolase